MPASVAALNSTNVRKSIALAWRRLDLAVSAVVVPGRAVDTAARLFATPPRFAHTPPEVDLLASGARFDVSTPQGRIAAWRFGPVESDAVILLHGWGGRGAQLRSFVPALLEAGYQAIAFDQPAHGHSDGREASLVQFVNGIDAVVKEIEARGARAAGMIGHSLGAAAATAWLNQTRREMRVVLLAAPTSLERYSGMFARRLGIPEAIRRAMQERFERRFGRRWDEFELPRSVAHVNAEALVIHDAEDRDVAPANGLALARAWRGACYLATRGLGHRAILRDPQVVADSVDFLRDRVRFAPPPPPGEAGAFFPPAPLL